MSSNRPVPWGAEVAGSARSRVWPSLGHLPTALMGRVVPRNGSTAQWTRFYLIPEIGHAPALECYAQANVVPLLARNTAVAVHGRWMFQWNDKPRLAFRVDQVTVLRAPPDAPTVARNAVPLPSVIRRVAVISSPSALGWGDVQAAVAEAPTTPVLVLYPVALTRADEIVDAIRRTSHDGFDAVALVRGGFDPWEAGVWEDPAVLAAITESPTPVLVAIGHAEDDTRADHAASRSFDTPWALGHYLLTSATPPSASPRVFASAPRGRWWVFVGIALLLALLLLHVLF